MPAYGSFAWWNANQSTYFPEIFFWAQLSFKLQTCTPPNSTAKGPWFDRHLLMFERCCKELRSQSVLRHLWWRTAFSYLSIPSGKGEYFSQFPWQQCLLCLLLDAISCLIFKPIRQDFRGLPVSEAIPTPRVTWGICHKRETENLKRVFIFLQFNIILLLLINLLLINQKRPFWRVATIVRLV